MSAERIEIELIPFPLGSGAGEPPVRTAVGAPAAPEPDPEEWGDQRKVYGTLWWKDFKGLTQQERSFKLIDMTAPDPYDLWEDYRYQDAFGEVIIFPKK